MTKKFSLPRGTSDVLPSQIFLWQEIECKTRQILANSNYKEMRTPIFEEVGLFKRSLGQTSDVVNKQLLELVSQKEEGFALRPEGTASIVRSYIENSLDRKEAISKLFYIGPMFRGERPQKGRLRQFHQVGVEVIGPNAFHPYLDAEIIALNVNIFKSLGLTNFKLKINTLGSLEDKENFSKELRAQLEDKTTQLCDDCQNRFERNVFRILDCKNQSCRRVVDGLKINNSYLSDESQNYFAKVKEALDCLGIKYEECIDLVRGLDYYTHTVFEISDSSLGSQDALSAGGRYNNLVAQLGGAEVPAMGFALGIERVILAMGEQGSDAPDVLDVFFVAMDEAAFMDVFKTINILRGANVSSDMSYRVSSMKSQMRLANKSGARFVVIVGEAELERKCVTLKNMETGDQQEIDISKDYKLLIDQIKER